MRAYCIGAFVAVTLAFSLSASANTTYLKHFHGSICVPTNGSRNIVDYNQYGITDISGSTTAWFRCGLSRTEAPVANETLMNVIATVYDRHPSASNEVACTLHVTDLGGNDVITPITHYTSGSSSSSISLIFPFTEVGGTPLYDRLIMLECMVPPIANGQSSHLTQIQVLSQTP